jgi:hypothetical protein
MFSTIAPATDVLTAFLTLGKKMPAELAMIECRAITEKLTKERAAAMIRPQIEEAVSTHEMVYDTYEGSEDQEAWTDEMDNAIETLLDSYSDSVTQDFIGRFCVSTRFHIPVARGMKSEAQTLAEAFANDVWRVLIHDSDEDAAPPRVLSTAKILSAVGIVKDDLVELMGDMPANAPQVQQKEDKPMRDINEILNEVHAYLDGEIDDKTVKDLFDMAIDSDDGLALSGVVPMGLDMDSVPTLRLFATKFGSAAPDEFVTALKGAPYEAEPTDSANDVALEVLDEAAAEGDETDPEMRELLGLPPLPAAPPATATPAIAGIRNRPPGVPAPPPLPGTPVPGPVDKRALTLIREHVKMKDDDVASGIGVSRQTYINYADPAKKATLVASPEQAAFLLQIVDDALAGLQEARVLLAD